MIDDEAEVTCSLILLIGHYAEIRKQVMPLAAFVVSLDLLIGIVLWVNDRFRDRRGHSVDHGIDPTDNGDEAGIEGQQTGGE